MQILFEELLPYKIMALIVLGLFYVVYFTKQLYLKKERINCIQIGKVKEKKANTVETLMIVATVGIVLVQILSIAFGWNYMPENARFTGFLVALIGDAIFIVSIICMQESWRVGIPKEGKTSLITNGVYAFSRNPAFLGFDLQYIGVLIMFCNPLTVCFTLFAMTMLHMQILQEEKYLLKTFGTEYKEYCSNVPGRYLRLTVGRKTKNR